MFTETRARLGWRTGASRLAMREQIERLQSFDPADRAHAGAELASGGLGRSAEPLLDHVANEFDDRVLSAIARAVIDEPVEPKESRRVQELRAWAAEAKERIALQDAFLGADLAPAPGGETAAYETAAYETAWEPAGDEPVAGMSPADEPAPLIDTQADAVEPDAEDVEALEAEIVDTEDLEALEGEIVDAEAAAAEVVDTDAVGARVAAALEQALAATVFATPLESAVEGLDDQSVPAAPEPAGLADPEDRVAVEATAVPEARPARPYISWRPPGEAEPSASTPVQDTGYRYEPPREYPVGPGIEAPREEPAAPEPEYAFEPAEEPAAPEPEYAFEPVEEPAAAPPRTLAERLKARSL